MARQPHVKPRSAAARYQWEQDHPRHDLTRRELLYGVAGGTIAALVVIGVLYLVGIFTGPIL
jgi:hypothetical protein